MKKRKRLLLMMALVSLVVLLSACGTSEVSAQSTGFWERYVVYYFAEAIKWLSVGGSRGIGIILFTLIIRIILLPLMNFQTKSMRKTQELQPKLKELQKQYSSKDTATQQKLREEQQRLYAENGVNPYAGCLPLIVQMPILMAIWQAISRVPELREGSFMWLDVLGNPDPYFILPILAAVFTFGSTYLSSMSQVESNPSMKIMTYTMPIMILVMGINLPSALSLYWVVSNAFQVGQTLLINNPYKIIREREEVVRQEKERERALRKAQNPKKKRKK
ncbi:YidC/Oxa1 family membrane protein insertase [Enterococcus saccharolyticus]|uniref:Membrane protein insertase YidC n=1 Tax=Enterococcus saccharolyticus subsp. saccharolyticus ATCC 43076 TaxID=1139996 RepID=S0J093_9ENTE|nr:YidC/Oxa1 family membrane protein insertase [Enterococcus saccharolyticus]EOT26229.1 membrane protein oxaA [Enterococcus saccharolyticus subsp. saccharolyticus ATCC 43076]EOT82824.1 membrane protein oxaA [Enterococcus saccharolyticus subsp. saccharolyticus ATCC 43076]